MPIVATALLMVHFGCASNRATLGLDSAAALAEAKGVFVRYTRLSVAPSDTDKFEALMMRCVEAARTAELPEQYEWLCYREAPRYYWLIVFSETIDGFATADNFEMFARRFGLAEGNEALQSINERLAQIRYEIERQIISQQYSAWSTVEGMSTVTHPKARATFYAVRRNASEAFNRALAARTSFLVEHNYSLPVEGFVIWRGGTDHAMQVVFPVNWDDYHKKDSIRSFVERLDVPARTEFHRLDHALAKTVTRIEQFDADFAGELRYSVK